MSVFTILCDSREQKPWPFDDYPVETREVTLKTGDYTLEDFCTLDEESGTYYPTVAVERKAPSDFVSSVSRDHERFKAEVKRASEWDEPLKVYVEAPWREFQNSDSETLKYRKVYPNQIEGTVTSWSKHYNVTFDFYSSRRLAEQATFDYLMTAYRAAQYAPR